MLWLAVASDWTRALSPVTAALNASYSAPFAETCASNALMRPSISAVAAPTLAL
jgi:hypothetical protein